MILSVATLSLTVLRHLSNTTKEISLVSKVTHRDIGSEAGDERGSDGIGDRGVGTLGLFPRSSNDVKPDKGIETGSCTLHHLQKRGKNALMRILL